MFEGFATTRVDTGSDNGGATINVVHGGSGPPVLLLHGFPQTHAMWHQVAPELAREHTVVAPDLRGYGDSSRPPEGDDHGGYAFRSMAADQVAVMRSLGHERFAVIGHDRGARVAHATKTSARFGLALWAVRGGRDWSAYPPTAA